MTQGLWVQSLRAHLPEESADSEQEETEVRYGSILDGVHVSAVFGRAEIGPIVEHIQYREEKEWKGGVRAAWRVGRGFKVVGQVVGPETEVRGGLTWEP